MFSISALWDRPYQKEFKAQWLSPRDINLYQLNRYDGVIHKQTADWVRHSTPNAQCLTSYIVYGI
jgi:hypothetical protein